MAALSEVTAEIFINSNGVRRQVDIGKSGIPFIVEELDLKVLERSRDGDTLYVRQTLAWRERHPLLARAKFDHGNGVIVREFNQVRQKGLNGEYEYAIQEVDLGGRRTRTGMMALPL